MPVLYLCWHFCDENICPKLIKYPRKRAWMTDTHERARERGRALSVCGKGQFLISRFLEGNSSRELHKTANYKLQIGRRIKQFRITSFVCLFLCTTLARSALAGWLEGGREEERGIREMPAKPTNATARRRSNRRRASAAAISRGMLALLALPEAGRGRNGLLTPEYSE